MCDKYLELNHKETIYEILEDPNEDKHFSFNINFLDLYEKDPNLGNQIFIEPEAALQEWDHAIRRVQTALILKSERTLVYKKNVHCRIYSLPACPDFRRTVFPRNEEANRFLQVSGTVVRMTAIKLLEYQRQYVCVKCKYVMIVTAEYELKNVIEPPGKCTNPEGCPGTHVISTGELDPDFCKDYQEIKMQENVNKLEVGCIPASMWVTLEDDLVDMCKPGDNIIVCGTVKRRWGPFIPGKRMDIELVIKANHIIVNNSSSTAASPELKEMFEAFWKTYSDNPLAARDIILQSICPQLFGLGVVKLAIAVVLAGGSHIADTSASGIRVRSEPHLLLVGDPGTGKSQLLRFASKIIPRSVLTTGVGSTAAGLTVTAVMENGEWQLEAGALVLSDGGICCIDEFNSMKEHDRTSIHEAMEQQTISVAKASIVCKLSTRCSILAATNPKGNLNPSQPLSMNIALPSPLLSRFDLILLLRDKINEEWDKLVTRYILNSGHNMSKLTDNIYWTVEILQAYFAIIKKTSPVLTEDSNRILSSYYQAQRRKNSRNKSRTTVRMLDSLVRLSQGHARLMFHKEVEIVDAVIAVTLVETSMENDSSVFDLQFDVQNDFPENPTETYRELVGIVLNKLQLPDLLEKELNSIVTKGVLRKHSNEGPGFDGDEPRIQSRFFQAPKTKNKENPARDIEKNKENHIVDANVVTNVHESGNNIEQEINKDNDYPKETENTESRNTNTDKRNKRSKGFNERSPKKRKLAPPVNDVLQDLASLDRIPSVNDNFPLLDDFKAEENRLDLDQAETDSESGKAEAGSNTKTANENKKENRNVANKEKVSRLSRFKFIPRETEMDQEKNCKCINASQASSINDDILKDFELVPQSTQRERPKFKFKKTDVINITKIEEPQLAQNAFKTKEDNSNNALLELHSTRIMFETEMDHEKNSKCNNESQASSINKDFELVPQSTQCERPKFKFKKTDVINITQIEEPQLAPNAFKTKEDNSTNALLELHSTRTIFETEEELDNLDLDI